MSDTNPTAGVADSQPSPQSDKPQTVNPVYKPQLPLAVQEELGLISLRLTPTLTLGQDVPVSGAHPTTSLTAGMGVTVRNGDFALFGNANATAITPTPNVMTTHLGSITSVSKGASGLAVYRLAGTPMTAHDKLILEIVASGNSSSAPGGGPENAQGVALYASQHAFGDVLTFRGYGFAGRDAAHPDGLFAEASVRGTVNIPDNPKLHRQIGSASVGLQGVTVAAGASINNDGNDEGARIPLSAELDVTLVRTPEAGSLTLSVTDASHGASPRSLGQNPQQPGLSAGLYWGIPLKPVSRSRSKK